MTPSVTGLDHLVLTVADLGQTVAFYQDILGMRAARFEAADGTQRWALYFGTQKINLHQAGAEFRPHAKAKAPGSADLCFLTETDLDIWQAHFHTAEIEVEAGPVARSGAKGPIVSLYVRDPDGNLIEVAQTA